VSLGFSQTIGKLIEVDDWVEIFAKILESVFWR
jgi:hypothetical protein